jgi:DNA-directed RNA polymerase subunit RPC12/RpoP
MKLIVEIPDFSYQCIKDGTEGNTAESDAVWAIRDGKPYEERLQGTWDHLQAIGDYKCSICGAENLYKYANEHERWIKINSNFCPNCGAKMQKGLSNENK